MVGRSNAVWASGLAVMALLGLSGCETAQQVVGQKEDSLSAAGFIIRPANTPDRQAMLNRLPPHRFVERVHGDQVEYVYADPLVCDCLYVGSQQAYGKYRAFVQQRQIADEQEMSAEMYSDAAWNWGAWGPYDGMAFGPGVGW
jgi:hypothetical protein